MRTAAAVVPVDEYLQTAYRPDVDFIKGELLERNTGERDHGQLQGAIYVWFHQRQRKSKIFPFLEQRIRIDRTRFRIPDVCLVAGAVPEEKLFGAPPFVCIEILSPEDRTGRVQDRIDDFLNFGVRYVWVIDPVSRAAWVHTRNGKVQSEDGILRTENPVIKLPLGEIFAEIDSL